MKKVLSSMLLKRKSSSLEQLKQQQGSDSAASIRSTSPSPVDAYKTATVIGMSFGNFSKTGKHHANEDVVVEAISLGDALKEAQDQALTWSYLQTDLETAETTSAGMFEELLNLDEVMFTAVYDGHGGSACSQFLKERLHTTIATLAHNGKFPSFDALCASSVIQDSFKICENAYRMDCSETHCGSCAIITLVHESSLLVAWLGDSRAVLYSGNSVIQVSKDHKSSSPEEYHRIVQQGGFVSGGRLMGVVAPSRAFGDADIKMQYPNLLLAEPSVLSLSMNEHMVPSQTSFLVLGSDGVYDALSNQDICKIISDSLDRSKNVDKAAKALVQAAAKLQNDDVTVSIVVWNHRARSSSSRYSSGFGRRPLTVGSETAEEKSSDES